MHFGPQELQKRLSKTSSSNFHGPCTDQPTNGDGNGGLLWPSSFHFSFYPTSSILVDRLSYKWHDHIYNQKKIDGLLILSRPPSLNLSLSPHLVLTKSRSL